MGRSGLLRLGPRSQSSNPSGTPALLGYTDTYPMPISLKRAYETPSRSDGCRLLVERLWPHALSKQDAKIDLWPKEAAPSTELRRWFNHEPDKWEEFKHRDFKELRARQESLHPVLERVRAGRVTFVFASRESRLNKAVALKEYVDRTT